MEKINKEAGAETFIRHYRNKYGEAPKQPPIWMAMEILTFKEVSKLFSGLRNKADTQRISKHVGWPDAVLRSWFRSLSDLRNLCAHHSRVWNREFGNSPLIPRKPPKGWALTSDGIPVGISQQLENSCINPQRRLYMQCVVIETLLKVVCPDSSWSLRLMQLLEEHPNVSRLNMGFPQNWDQQAFWQLAQKDKEVLDDSH